MTYKEVEQKLYKKMLEIADIYKEFNPEDTYLNLCLFNRGEHVSINNGGGREGVKPINFFVLNGEFYETEGGDENA